jgi:hypothetical protein
MPDLSNAILQFFIEKMKIHDLVDRCERLPIEDDCIFKIYRRRNLPPVTVFLSDAYDYGFGEYLTKPRGVDFILIARPEAGFDPSLIARAKADKLGIGKIGKFMGALNNRDIWK